MTSSRQKSSSNFTSEGLGFRQHSAGNDTELTPPTSMVIPYHPCSQSKGFLSAASPTRLRHVWQCVSPAPFSDFRTSAKFTVPSSSPSSPSHTRKGLSFTKTGTLHSQLATQPVRATWGWTVVIVTRISLAMIAAALLFSFCLFNKALIDVRRGKLASKEPTKSRLWTWRRSGNTDSSDDDHARTVASVNLLPLPPSGAKTHGSAGRRKPTHQDVANIEDDPSVVDEVMSGTEVKQTSHRYSERARITDSTHTEKRRHPAALTRGRKVQNLAAADINIKDSFSSAKRWDQPRTTPRPNSPSSTLAAYGGQKVAVVVPYLGSDLPAWWNSFAEQARMNDGLVDWIIFCDQKLERKGGPPNIKFFPMSTRRIAWLLAGVVDESAPSIPRASGNDSATRRDESTHHVSKATVDRVQSKASFDAAVSTGVDVEEAMNKSFAAALAKRRRASSFLHRLLITSPYYIVEFKPALGWLFRDYLGDYSHWAYGDLDVLFGDMRKGWLEPVELREFDIITFSFGDQYRAYLRGQLTIHKNERRVNRIWTECSHLVNYSERLEAFRVSGELSLESAEGCYSRAAASDASLKIKFSVKALSDVDKEGREIRARDREVVIDGNGLVTLCPDLGYYEGSIEGSRHWGAMDHGDERDDQLYPSMQNAVGTMTAVQRTNTSEGRCEPWIKAEHQTCVDDVEANHTLLLVAGRYYKQEFVNTAAATGGRRCRAGAFYHFQAHKVNYRSWNCLPPIPEVHSGVAAGPGGIVPLPAAGWKEHVSGLRRPAAHSVRHRRYCLAWIERRRMRNPGKGLPEQLCAVQVSSDEAVILFDTRESAPRTSDLLAPDADRAVTLGGMGNPDDLATFLSTAAEWADPKVFAMVVNSEDLGPAREMAIFRRIKYIRGGVLIVALVRPPPDPGMPKSIQGFPHKTLMNLVSDLCQTRFLLTIPRLSRLTRGAYTAVTEHLARAHPTRATPPGTGHTPSKYAGPITLIVPIEGSTLPTPVRHALTPAKGRTAQYRRPTTAIEFAYAARDAASVALKRARATLAESWHAEKAAAAVAVRTAATAAAIEAAEGGRQFAVRGFNSVDGGVGRGETPGERRRGTIHDEDEAGFETENPAPILISFGTTTDSGWDIDDSNDDEGGRMIFGHSIEGGDEHLQPPGIPRWPQRIHVRDGGSEGPLDNARLSPAVVPEPDGEGDLRDEDSNASSSRARDSREDLGQQRFQTGRRHLRYTPERHNDDNDSNHGEGDAENGAGIDWDEDGQEIADWVSSVFFSETGMPGLVVDRWAPGTLFIRQVEEFGDKGCMDAAYALGLWRAGSRFEVVHNAGIKLEEPSAQPLLYEELEGLSERGHILNVPGGACLRSEAMSKTASIYSAFLQQVGNVYRPHARSEAVVEAQQPTPDNKHK